MKLHKLLKLLTLIMLVFNLSAVRADDLELCGAFTEDVVSPVRVKQMLTAAKSGHLYRIQPGSSKVGFCVNSKLSKVKGEFRDFSGGLSLWPEAGNNEQAMVLIKTASLDTDGSIVENVLKGKRFFDVKNHPDILFLSTGISWQSETTALLKGELTMNDITRPVTMQVTLNSEDGQAVSDTDNIVAIATTIIKRSDFGMDDLKQLVDEEVRLCMSVRAVRYRAGA